MSTSVTLGTAVFEVWEGQTLRLPVLLSQAVATPPEGIQIRLSKRQFLAKGGADREIDFDQKYFDVTFEAGKTEGYAELTPKGDGEAEGIEAIIFYIYIPAKIRGDADGEFALGETEEGLLIIHDRDPEDPGYGSGENSDDTQDETDSEPEINYVDLQFNDGTAIIIGEGQDNHHGNSPLFWTKTFRKGLAIADSVFYDESLDSMFCYQVVNDAGTRQYYRVVADGHWYNVSEQDYLDAGGTIDEC